MDWIADLIAFAWWKHDHDKAEHEPHDPRCQRAPHQGPCDVANQPHDENVRKAWNAVVGEWEDVDDERLSPR